jgi:photosystem II stability/assembly factor-like uncharacterized protein
MKAIGIHDYGGPAGPRSILRCTHRVLEGGSLFPHWLACSPPTLAGLQLIAARGASKFAPGKRQGAAVQGHFARVAFSDRNLGKCIIFLLLVELFLPVGLVAQQYDPSLFSDMRWRMIGPTRGGRALTATGVRGQSSTYYFGAVGGGVWKTTDAGRVWTPIFDHEPIASIGAVAVAPSDPNVIYVGSGEADMRSDISYGNGMYKSTDAGATWTQIGLEDSWQIGRILIDPNNPEVVFVAALGHAYAPNDQRGVFRSTDGGKTWQRVLFKDENTGAIDLAFDPSDPHTLYAALWQTRRPPWNVYPPSNGPGSGLYKSTDGGNTWEQLTGHGLQSEGLGRIGIAVAPTKPNRVYLIVDAKQGGVYRSDDAGQNWQLADSEPRIWGRGWYFGGITVDPKNADIVYVCNTSTYRSTDGGKSFDAVKGAPGGDDYHNLWIDPDDPQRMIVSSDQGVVISVDGAKTWTTWYNQPTAQLYHVITDTRFPYWVYGAQQDSGSVGVLSRSNGATITFRDWRPVGAGGESMYIAPDPLDPNILYGGSFGAAVGRYNLTTGETRDISPALAHPGQYRRTWTLPTVFSPRDPHELYFSTQILFRTVNGGQTWQVLSPDLTREDPGVPPNLDPPTAADGPNIMRRGVIYTIAPSPLRAGEIWIGTDDGFIQVTPDDGKTWHNVTPPELTPWSKVGLLEASRHDANTVYAAVDRHRLDDLHPHIYRTHDGGKTWQHITKGIPVGSYVNAVREDPQRRGVLYAGTETGVFVSFNDGDNWQPLQLNLPNASVRDLVVHGDDLVIATHGRSFWILDDLTPLRQLSGEVAGANAWLFRPGSAWRVRSSSFEGTPLPPEEPQGENPPNGAIINYYLKSKPVEPVTLEVLDRAGKLVRRYSSADKVPPVNPKSLDIPMYWIHPGKTLSGEPGMHRFTWDVHYPSAPSVRNRFAAMFGLGTGPWAPPGQYTVRLTVGGHAYTQPLTLKMDPRVKTTEADLVKQFTVAREIGASQARVQQALHEANNLRESLRALQGKLTGQEKLAGEAETFKQKLTAIAGPPPPRIPAGFGEEDPNVGEGNLRTLVAAWSEVDRAVESADAAPTADAVTAFGRNQLLTRKLRALWEEVKSKDLLGLNESLKKAGLQALSLEREEGRPEENSN